MSHVTVNYEMFLPGGHHRQPRNTSIELNLAPTSGGDVSNPGVYTPPFFSELPYTLNGGSGMAKLLFWSVTDGNIGQVLAPSPFNQPVAISSLLITAWYYPISGPGSAGAGSGIIDDAFSAKLGRFIDDTFVEVISDPTLSSDANVLGEVPTIVAETLVANGLVASTGEPFAHWILNDSLEPYNNTRLQLPEGTDGIAIAIYQQAAQGALATSKPGQYAIWQWVDYGTMVDGGPHPWNPYVNQLMSAVAVAAASSAFDVRVRGLLVDAAIQQIQLAALAIEASIRTDARR